MHWKSTWAHTVRMLHILHHSKKNTKLLVCHVLTYWLTHSWAYNELTVALGPISTDLSQTHIRSTRDALLTVLSGKFNHFTYSPCCVLMCSCGCHRNAYRIVSHRFTVGSQEGHKPGILLPLHISDAWTDMILSFDYWKHLLSKKAADSDVSLSRMSHSTDWLMGKLRCHRC